MKLLTVRQPWASLIISGDKDVENRSWSTRYRGRVLILAGKAKPEREGFDLAAKLSITVPALPRGYVIGSVEFVDVVTASSSPWFEGPFGFVLRDPQPIDPIPWLGSLGLREAPPQLARLYA